MRHVSFRRWGYLVLFAAMLASCDRSSKVSVQSSNAGPPLPTGLGRAIVALPANATLEVHVYHSESLAPVRVKNIAIATDGVTLADINVQLPAGRHRIYLEYWTDKVGCAPLFMARTTPTPEINLTPPTAIVDFSAVQIVEPLPDSNGNGISNVDELLAGRYPCLPLAPQNLTLVPGENQVSLQWDSVTTAAEYSVYYGTDPELSMTNYLSRAGTRMQSLTNSVVIKELTGETLHYFFVTAKNAHGESMPIAENATPTNPKPPTTQQKVVEIIVSGLAEGETTVLDFNGGDPLTITSNDFYSVSLTLVGDATVTLAVRTQPVTQHCKISLSNVAAAKYLLTCHALALMGGNVTGLTGSGLKLKNSATGEELSIAANGSFQFAMRVRPGDAAVSVVAQPITTPAQICAVEPPVVRVGDADVTSLTVSCVDAPVSEGQANGNAQGIIGPVEVSLNAAGLRYTGVTVVQNGPFISRFLKGTYEHDRSNYFLEVTSTPVGVACAIGAQNIVNSSNNTVYGFELVCAQIDVRTNPGDRYTELAWSEVPGAADYSVVWVPSNSVCAPTALSLPCSDASRVTTTTTHQQLTGLTNDQLYQVWISARFTHGAVLHSNVVAVTPSTWATNATVRTLAAASNGTVYFGGDFNQVFAYSGNGFWAPRVDQASNVLPGPIFSGGISQVIEDGAGGWYVGGEFSVLGMANAKNLVHVTKSRQINVTFMPSPNARVTALHLHNGMIYVAGDFTTIATINRPSLAALNRDGTAVLNWGGGIQTNAPIDTMTVLDNTLYLGGRFTQIKFNQSRNYLAAVAADTGVLAEWNPTADRRVYALATGVDVIYAGGEFSTLGAVARRNLAAIDSNGVVVNTWLADVLKSGIPGTLPDSRVTALTVHKGTLYVGGEFDAIQGLFRRRLASIDVTTGKVTPWTVEVGSANCCAPIGGRVRTIAVMDNVVYIGGEFSTVNNSPRRHAAALEALTGRLLPWIIEPNSPVNTLAVDSLGVLIGGQFSGVGAHDRKHAAALTPTGILSHWQVELNASVSGIYRLRVDENERVYAVGDFSRVGADTRSRAAAFDTGGGGLLSWNPHVVNTDVDARHGMDLVVMDNAAYISGAFSAVGVDAARVDRTGLAATNFASGAALDSQFDLRATSVSDAAAWAMAASNDGLLYIGGPFTGIGNTSNAHLAVIDHATKTVRTDWMSPIAGVPRALALHEGLLYVGGLGSLRNAATPLTEHGSLVGIDVTTRQIVPMPLVTGTVRTITPVLDVLYVGGTFSSLGDQARPGVGAVRISKGNYSVTSWNPSLMPDAQVHATAVANGQVYIGGFFRHVGGRPANIAVLSPSE